MESARPAVAVDVDGILALTTALRAELAQHRGGAWWIRTHDDAPPSAAGLHARLADPDGHLVVGCIDGLTVGYALAGIRRLADGGRLAEITEVFVQPDARAVGVGERMIDEVLSWAGEQGCEGVDATALPGHRAAKSFFEAHGFLARSLVMHRSLPAGRGRSEHEPGS